MSKWLGFIVGLAISITVVMTVVRPGNVRDAQTSQRIELPVAADDALEAVSPATEAGVGRGSGLPEPTPSTDASPADDEAAPRTTPAAPSPARDEPTDEEVDPYATEETRLAAVPSDLLEPVAEPIPAFDWNAAPDTSDQVETVPLPEPQVTVIDGNVVVADAPAASTAPAPPAAGVEAPSVPAPAAPLDADATQTGSAAIAHVPGRQWYAFWQPFGSELSARGFSARLERITGLDYRVVKVDSGEYHVAFGYEDEESRLANLSTIEAATGLRLGGQSL